MIDITYIIKLIKEVEKQLKDLNKNIEKLDKAIKEATIEEDGEEETFEKLINELKLARLKAQVADAKWTLAKKYRRIEKEKKISNLEAEIKEALEKGKYEGSIKTKVDDLIQKLEKESPKKAKKIRSEIQ